MLAAPPQPRTLPFSRPMTHVGIALTLAGCVGGDSRPTLRAESAPLHLEAYLDRATVRGSVVPADAASAVSWQFDEILSDWRPVTPWNPTVAPATVAVVEDALRVTLTEDTKNPRGNPRGGLFMEVPGWDRQDWAHILVRARATGAIESSTS